MAFQTPTGEVYLLRNQGWDRSYKHVKYFDSNTAQEAYILSTSEPDRLIAKKEGLQIVKNPLQGTLRLSGYQSNYMDCSYIAIKNQKMPDATDDYPYIYAFVDDVRYVSNSAFEIDYTVDVFQTYLIGSNKPCSVEKALIKRTHVQTDTKYKYLEPEPVSFGEYKVEKLSSLITDPSFRWVVYAPFNVTSPPTAGQSFPVKMSGMAGGVLQGLTAVAYDSYNDMSDDIENMDSELASQIVAIVAMPKGFITSGKLSSVQPNTKTEATTRPSKIDGYTPTNNKLWSYPYCTLLLSNAQGSNRTLRYEYFDDPESINFHLTLGIGPNPELICAPIKYGTGFLDDPDVEGVNYTEAIAITNFPHVSWTGNGFLTWARTAGAHAIADSISSLFSLDFKGMLQGMTHTAIDATNASMTNAKSYGNTCGSLALMADGMINFFTFNQCINKRDAKRIDDFFSRYGYAINTIETVHLTNPRFNQHYVETSECIVKGGAPMQAIETITNAFNSGVTFWKNNIGEYTLK